MVYTANWGIICHPSHLIREPKITIENIKALPGFLPSQAVQKDTPPGAEGGACCGVTSVTDLNAGVGVGVFLGDLLQGDWSLGFFCSSKGEGKLKLPWKLFQKKTIFTKKMGGGECSHRG